MANHGKLIVVEKVDDNKKTYKKIEGGGGKKRDRGREKND